MGNGLTPETVKRTFSDPARALCYSCQHRRDIPGDAHSRCAGAIYRDQVTGNEHGIRSGWFFWPFNFDPVWLESCTNYSPVEKAQP